MVKNAIRKLAMAIAGLSALLAMSLGAAANAAPAPSVIKIGVLYSGSGSFATESMPELAGLKFWIRQVNGAGGVYVKPLHKKVKIDLIAYNDQSNPTTATNLYTQLITVDHVNYLMADFGSVLTAPAVTLAKEYKTLLIDASGTSVSFFTPGNPYIVLTALATSGLWPDSLAGYLISHKVKRVAIVYDTNDFDGSQHQTLVAHLKAAGITPVYDNGVATSTSSYQVILHNIQATHPQAVIELGYNANDIPFLQQLKASGIKFPFVFTIFPGQQLALFQKNVGDAAVGTYTYPAPPSIQYNSVNFGLTTQQFEKKFGATEFENIAGYLSGLVMQQGLQNATSVTALGLRQGIYTASGKMRTLEGAFILNKYGAQVGELLPIGKVIKAGKGLGLQIVYQVHQ